MAYCILIVDDEEKIRTLIRKYAEFEGHDVYEASNGMDAVELCRKRNFDLIVMDIMMPILDGFSACRKIKAFSDVPVIMLSARGEEYDKISGFEMGVDDYVVKPFSPKELMLRIEAVLKRAGGGKSKTKTKSLKSAGCGRYHRPGRLPSTAAGVNLSPKDTTSSSTCCE